MKLGGMFMQMTAAPLEPFQDECVATGRACSYGPYGPKQEIQCRHCGTLDDKPYRITEEVPGVPKEEQYFISGPGITYETGHPHFPTYEAAKKHCDDKGWAFRFIPFEP